VQLTNWASCVTAKIKIEAHKNERRKLKLTSLVRAVHATRAGVKCIISQGFLRCGSSAVA